MDLHYTDNRISTIEHWSSVNIHIIYIYIYIGIYIIRKYDKSDDFIHKELACMHYIYMYMNILADIISLERVIILKRLDKKSLHIWILYI